MDKHTSTKSTWIDYLLLSLIILITYNIFLGAYPLLTPDEGRYSEVAREMLAQGQFVTPTVNNTDFFDKPILYYWLQASALYLFGVKEWAVRLWPMLFGWFGVLITYFVTNKLVHRKAAWVAALILGSSSLYYFAAHYANMDLEVAVWITASLSSFLIAYQPATKTFNARGLYGAYIFAALAVLTKGLIGIVFPIMVIGLWILITHQWAIIKRMRIITGLLLLLVIVLPWFILVAQRNPGFLHYYFYIQQVQRFLLPNFNNQQPFWFYLPVVFGGMLPWAVVLPSALKLTWQQRNAQLWYLLVWVAAIFVFFSIPSSKLLGYILPVIPPLAILIGWHYQQISAKLWKAASVFQIIFWVALASFLIFIPSKFQVTYGLSPSLCFMAATLILLAAAGLLWIVWRQSSRIIVALAIGNLIVFNILLGTAAHIDTAARDRIFPIKPLVATLKTVLTPQDKVVIYYTYYHDLPLYLQQPVLITHNWQQPGLAQVDSWRGEFAYAMQYLQPQANAWLIDNNEFAKIWNSKIRTFVFISNKKMSLLQAAFPKQPSCIFAQQGNVLVLTNDKALCKSRSQTY